MQHSMIPTWYLPASHVDELTWRTFHVLLVFAAMFCLGTYLFRFPLCLQIRTNWFDEKSERMILGARLYDGIRTISF